jgi:NAD(P)-dependent dehydrogenase (short-subunit alcohol dehydrogenase family)
MSGQFEGQVVVVTGGGRGIGRAIALEFAAEGATTVLAGRRMDALQTAAAEVRHAGGKSDVASCDVMKDEDLSALVDRTIERHGRIDVLVNNAGVVTGGRLDEILRDDIDRIVGVNVWAPLRLTQLALPHMRAARRGTIVNISSFAGRVGTPYLSVYSASKFAMRGFSEALRREVQPDGVHVCAVYPGVTATDMLEAADFPTGLGMTVATAQQVGQAVLRSVRWRLPEVFIGIGESIISRVNDFMPWSVDVGMELMRDRFRDAVRNSRTT